MKKINSYEELFELTTQTTSYDEKDFTKEFYEKVNKINPDVLFAMFDEWFRQKSIIQALQIQAEDLPKGIYLELCPIQIEEKKYEKIDINNITFNYN